MLDDDLQVIYELISRENFDLSNKEFLLPEMGYNQKIDKDKFGLIAINNSSLVYYSDTKSINIK